MDLNLLFGDFKGAKEFFKKNLKMQVNTALIVLIISLVLFIILKSELFLFIGVSLVICQFTIKRWFIQILLVGVLIGYGVLFLIIGNDLRSSSLGACLLSFALAGLHFWEIRNYLKNYSLLERIEDDLNSYPNDPDLTFKRIALLNKLGKTENVIDSTETLIEILENRQSIHYDGTSFEERKRSRWDIIKNTIWYDFDIFEPRESLNTFVKKKKAKQFGIWVLITSILLVILIYYYPLINWLRMIIIIGILLIYLLYGFIKYSY